MTSLSCTDFFNNYYITALLSLLKSAETVFSLFISILFTSAFKLAKSDFAAKLDLSALIATFKYGFVLQLDRYNSTFTFPL